MGGGEREPPPGLPLKKGEEQKPLPSPTHRAPLPPCAPRPLLILPLLLLATPAVAARTATIAGAPTAHASPDATTEVTGHPPSGATVTVERCTSDATTIPLTVLGADEWCLLRGVGWVMGQGLVNLSADPAALLPEDGAFDPLKDTTPAWDDLDASPDDAPPPPSF